MPGLLPGREALGGAQRGQRTAGARLARALSLGGHGLPPPHQGAESSVENSVKRRHGLCAGIMVTMVSGTSVAACVIF